MTTPEIRIDQLTGMRAILAPGRADRPDVFRRGERAVEGGAECPFCEGHEERTPPEVWARRPGGGGPDTPGWTARSVPNLYPALGGDPGNPGAAERGGGTGALADAADPLAASRRGTEANLFSSRPAAGSHEVIVHTPVHTTAMADLRDEALAGAVEAWRERMRAHRDAPCVQLIVNEGGSAGASLEHTHAQLYALPFVPAAVARERERASAYAVRTAGGNLLTDVLVEEVRRRDRLVAIDDDAALLAPWASRSPFELRIVPRRAAARFEDGADGAPMLATALRALRTRFDGPPEMNLWVRTAPHGAEHFQWHIDIVPRLTVRAGFELGTGVDINVYPPERAAADLREVIG